TTNDAANRACIFNWHGWFRSCIVQAMRGGCVASTRFSSLQFLPNERVRVAADKRLPGEGALRVRLYHFLTDTPALRLGGRDQLRRLFDVGVCQLFESGGVNRPSRVSVLRFERVTGERLRVRLERGDCLRLKPFLPLFQDRGGAV